MLAIEFPAVLPIVFPVMFPIFTIPAVVYIPQKIPGPADPPEVVV